MKNLHVSPTEKPSRLSFDIDEKFYILSDEPTFFAYQYLVQNRNIYITSEEKTKGGDHVLNTFPDKHILDIKLDDYKKIILTTDQDLIDKGIQAIDDKFLQWFVQNHTCEFVEVEKISNIEIEEVSYEGDFQNVERIHYKIIIPQ